MGQSIYLREVLGREEGAPPPVDLAKEKANGNFIRTLINDRMVTAVHDISDGGLAVAVLEMALLSSFGAKLENADHISLFAEDQARYVITALPEEAIEILDSAQSKNIPARIIGEVTAEPFFRIGSKLDLAMAELRRAHEDWFPTFMGG
jgi:phosphoribosylformylglycinamidine synthase